MDRFIPILTLLFFGSTASCAKPKPLPSEDDVPQFVRCATDDDCSEQFRCTSRVCVSRDDGAVATQIACGPEEDCGQGMECRRSRCVAIVTRCTGDYDCGFGESCIHGACQPRADGPPECESDGDCPGVCAGGQCQ